MADSPFAGFVRVAAAVPRVRVTDFTFNREQTLLLWQRASDAGCAVVYFPELGLSSYTAGDLHLNRHLQQAVLASLDELLREGERRGLTTLAFVGLPLFVHPGLYNVAAAIQGGRILGIIPKTYLPNYREFYEPRQFRPGNEVPDGQSIEVLGQRVPFGRDLLFPAENQPGLVVGVEICEDGWVQISPNAYQTSAGATVCGNLSASNFTVGKGELRHRLCWKASDPGKCAYVYTAAGPGESSSDLAFDAHAMIYENGRCLVESERFAREEQLLMADIDLEMLLNERLSTGSFGECARANERPFREIPFVAAVPDASSRLLRRVERHPFVPKDPATLATRCWEVFQIQTSALINRVQYMGTEHLALALSGGRDSTLAALACVAALDQLGLPRANLHCLSMPGFGTSAHTRDATRRLAESLAVSLDEEDIREECLLVLQAQKHPLAEGFKCWCVEHGRSSSVAAFEEYIAHNLDQADVEFENVQARVRKLRSMMLANRYRGLEIGTGDLSEKALGWSTYAGDQISMYDLNAGIPKTLVSFIVEWVASEQAERWTSGDPTALRQALSDILAAPITPELLPLGTDKQIAQLSESTIGPYELHDFFLFWFVRHGTRPARILTLAHTAFDGVYSDAELRKWLVVFLRRFFGNQWKRDCTADGPKVGTVALSPRGDWRMPSDAVVQSWIADVETANP